MGIRRKATPEERQLIEEVRRCCRHFDTLGEIARRDPVGWRFLLLPPLRNPLIRPGMAREMRGRPVRDWLVELTERVMAALRRLQEMDAGEEG